MSSPLARQTGCPQYGLAYMTVGQPAALATPEIPQGRMAWELGAHPGTIHNELETLSVLTWGPHLLWAFGVKCCYLDVRGECDRARWPPRGVMQEVPLYGMHPTPTTVAGGLGEDETSCSPQSWTPARRSTSSLLCPRKYVLLTLPKLRAVPKALPGESMVGTLCTVYLRGGNSKKESS